jgi:hypothetical protein
MGLRLVQEMIYIQCLSPKPYIIILVGEVMRTNSGAQSLRGRERRLLQ